MEFLMILQKIHKIKIIKKFNKKILNKINKISIKKIKTLI